MNQDMQILENYVKSINAIGWEYDVYIKSDTAIHKLIERICDELENVCAVKSSIGGPPFYMILGHKFILI